jgi:hypothetical protein
MASLDFQAAERTLGSASNPSKQGKATKVSGNQL